MSGGNNVLITDTDLTQAQRLQEQTSSLPNIGNDGNRTVEEYLPNDDFENFECDDVLHDSKKEIPTRTCNENFKTTFKNINLQKQASLSGNSTSNVDTVGDPRVSEEEEIEDAGNQQVFKELMRAIENPAKPPRNMDKALDTLWTIESYLDEENQKELKFRTDWVFWGTFKNVFCKFLGFFCKSFAEKRTQELNNQINAVVGNITDEIRRNTDFGKNLQQQILVPILDDDNIDEELKTTCLRLFSNEPEFQKELFQKIEKPSSDVLLYALNHWKKEIKNGKLFGNDVCDRWLSPLINDENTTKETKLKLYAFFDDNPDIQDKLFKSLKNPPNEIRKDFWEKNKQEIVSGKFFGFVGSDKDKTPYGVLFEEDIKNLFLNNEYPLATLFLTMAKARQDLDKSIFADKKNWKLMQNSDQQKKYMKAACSLTQEQVFQSLENARKIDCNKVAEDQSENIGKVLNFLKSPQSDNIDILKENPKGAFYTMVVKDTRRSMHYSFIFGGTKIDLSEFKSEAEGSKVFFETLKSKLYNAQKENECLLNENQLKQLVNFIFYSPSQGYLAAQLGNVIYKPFDGDMSVQVEFKEKEGPVVTIKNKNAAYDSTSFQYPLDVEFTDLGFKPRVQTSGTLKLTYENPIDASNVNKYEISVENYEENITLEKP